MEYSKYPQIRTYDFGLQADEVLIYQVLSDKSAENVVKMFLKFILEILYT